MGVKKKAVDIVNVPETIFLILFFLGAALIRLLYVNDLALRSPFFSVDTYTFGPSLYLQWAKTIAQGDFFLSSSNISFFPLYSYVIALFSKMTESIPLFFRIIQVLVGVGSCVMLFFIGRKVGNLFVGVVSMGIACFYQMNIFYDAIFLPITFHIFLNLIIVYLLLLTFEHSKSSLFISIGCFLGINSLLYSPALFFVPFVCCALIIIFYKYQKPIIIKSLFLVIVSFLLIYCSPLILNVFTAKKITIAGQMQQYQQILEQTQGWSLENLRLFFHVQEIPDIEDSVISSRFSWILHMPLGKFVYILPLALLGLFLVFIRKNRKLRVVVIMSLGVFLYCMCYSITASMRLPIVPFFILFAVNALYQCYLYIVLKKWSNIFLCVAFVVFCFSIFNIPIEKSYADSYFHLGRGYLQNKEASKAVNEFKKVIVLSPDNYQGYLFLAMAYLKQGRFDIALKNIHMAKQLSPNNQQIEDVLVKAQEELKKSQRSKSIVN